MPSVTTEQTYGLGDKRFWLGLQQRESILQRGGEMAVWEQRLAPLLTDLKPNVKSLVNTAFTKMLNNALDHSNGIQVLMGMHLEGGQLQLVVADDGEGIFYKIAESAHLFDERLAHVGQAFVDEVYRVFATAHPHVRLKTMGMTPEVAKLVSLFGGA